MTENDVSRHVVNAAVEVHRTLGGPGLMEKVYEEALCFELSARGLTVERQTVVPLFYKGNKLRLNLRLDMVVADCVIVECKAAIGYHPVFEAQALTYLRISHLRLALVINFGNPHLRQGIRRVVNGLPTVRNDGEQLDAKPQN
jgi:GxxExxY protein